MISLKLLLYKLLEGHKNYCPWDVGNIYITTSDITTSTLASRWPNTTWQEYGKGQLLVGYSSSDTAFNSVGKTGGKKEIKLSGLYGCTDDSSSTFGMATSGVTSYQNSHGATYIPWTYDQGARSWWNHSCPVVETTSSSRNTTNLQPYCVVRMFKRTA